MPGLQPWSLCPVRLVLTPCVVVTHLQWHQAETRRLALPQVATPRVRTAVKPDIPHVDDHVSKLHAVGAMTQQKLQDIRAACEAAGVAVNVPLPHNCITKGAAHLPACRLSARAAAVGLVLLNMILCRG